MIADSVKRAVKVNELILVFGVLGLFALAYRLYGGRLARLFELLLCYAATALGSAGQHHPSARDYLSFFAPLFGMVVGSEKWEFRGRVAVTLVVIDFTP